MTEIYLKEWDDVGQILDLAKKDSNELEKKVKLFFKNLFKNNNPDSENRFDSKEILMKLNDFNEFINNIGKKKECKHIVMFALNLLIGHSRIRKLLLESREGFVRRKFVELVCLLISSQPEAVIQEQTNIVDFILGAYDATFSIEDQTLLKLLFLLESHGLKLQQYQPFIWGLNGALFYASKHSQKLAFLKTPTIDEMFKGFEGKRLSHSLSAFPIFVTMTDKIEVLDSVELTSSNMYDPRFIIPTFYHFLTCQSISKCHKFISYGCMSYTVAALSSFCPRIRAIAYKILGQLHYYLYNASYPQDRQLWTGLIDYIRTGLTEENQRLYSVHTVLIVQMIDILLKPIGPMYSSVRQYLISQQMKPLNYNSLSSFYHVCIQLVTTNDPQVYSLYQKFAIQWIIDSLRTSNDVRLCNYKNIFKDMLVLYNSPICSSENKQLIMKLLITLAQLYEGVKVLCYDCAIFSWIKHLLLIVPNIESSEETNKNMLFKLVVTIWNTVFNKFFVEQSTTNTEHKPFIFYEAFGFELIDVLSRIVYRVNEKSRIEKFTEICQQILSYNENEQNNYNTKLLICSNLPFNLESMIASS